MKQKSKLGFVLEYVKDIKAARRFYVDVLGLEVKREHPTFIQFDGFAIASDTAMGDGKARELYFTVENAETAYAGVAKSTTITSPLRDEAFGKVFSIEGPAGQPLYLVQFAAQRPSTAVGAQPRNEQRS